MVKASAHNAGDPGSIPGSGRTPGEGKIIFFSIKKSGRKRRSNSGLANLNLPWVGSTAQFKNAS